MACSNFTTPIVILHRNEADNLEKMIEAIFISTRREFIMFVVDNNSNKTELNKLSRLASRWPIHVIRNFRNNWVLGFNLALTHPYWPSSSPYIVLSDADIIVPDLAGECWLSYLTNEMDRHACIGKLGVSLKFDDITVRELVETVSLRETKFRTYPKIGDHYIAPVDTTLAIYRKDLYFGSQFRLKVGHASRVRPYYYVCRTDEKLEARHLGWYAENRIDLSSQALAEKIRCFAKYGGYVEAETLAELPISLRLYYKTVSKLSRLYWGISVAIEFTLYCLRSFPRGLNRIQDNLR